MRLLLSAVLDQSPLAPLWIRGECVSKGQKTLPPFPKGGWGGFHSWHYQQIPSYPAGAVAGSVMRTKSIIC